MSAMLPSQRRAESFAAAVDADVSDPRFDVLLEVVGALRTAAADEPAVPRTAYTRDLRERLMLAADTDLVPTDAKLLLPQRSTATTRRQGRWSAAAAAFVVVAGTAGIATASGSSVPGDSLYPFKRGVEAAHQAISFGDAARGRDKLGQADARLDELTKMARGDGDQSQFSDTVQAFIEQGGDGADLLFRDFDATGNTDSVRAVRAFAGTAMAELTSLSSTAPASLQSDLAQAASLLGDIDQQASVLCSDCGARSAIAAPSSLRPASNSLDNLLAPVRTVIDTSTTAADPTDTGDTGTKGDDGGTTTDPVGDTVNKVVDGATGGSGGGGSTTTKDPVGSILGNLPSAVPSAVGKVVDGAGSAVGSVTK